jgi:hypothetical protein
MVTEPHHAVRDAGRELLAAASALNEILLLVADQMAKVGTDLDAGKTVIEAMAGAEVSQYRSRTNEAIERFEQARHKLRLASFGSALAEGATTEELAKVWDMPLSMVERFARQALANAPRPK